MCPENKDAARISDNNRRHHEEERPRNPAVRSAATAGICETGGAHPRQHYRPDDGPRLRLEQGRNQHGSRRKAPKHGEASPIGRPIPRTWLGARAATLSRHKLHRRKMPRCRSRALPESAGRVHRHKSRTRSSRPSTDAAPRRNGGSHRNIDRRRSASSPATRRRTRGKSASIAVRTSARVSLSASPDSPRWSTPQRSPPRSSTWDRRQPLPSCSQSRS